MVGTADIETARNCWIVRSTSSGLNQRSSAAREPRMWPAFITVSPYEWDRGSTDTAQSSRSSSWSAAAARALDSRLS